MEAGEEEALLLQRERKCLLGVKYKRGYNPINNNHAFGTDVNITQFLHHGFWDCFLLQGSA